METPTVRHGCAVIPTDAFIHLQGAPLRLCARELAHTLSSGDIIMIAKRKNNRFRADNLCDPDDVFDVGESYEVFRASTAGVIDYPDKYFDLRKTPGTVVSGR